MKHMQCKICSSATVVITNKRILNKYDVNYHQCVQCHFIQTDEPFWLEEAYASAITDLDIGLISRNIYLQNTIPPLLDTCFPTASAMLDYGGGYGMFVRMMRDKGYNFYRQDNFCENLFANYFDLADSPDKKFDVLTAFEVFEHLADPVNETQKMLDLAGNIIFSTLLIPGNVKDFDDWWYVSPLIGQHIAFYDKKTLLVLADKFGKKLYSNNENLHIFSSRSLDRSAVDSLFKEPKRSLLKRLADRFFYTNKETTPKPSLLQKDYELIEKKLTSKKL